MMLSLGTSQDELRTIPIVEKSHYAHNVMQYAGPYMYTLAVAQGFVNITLTSVDSILASAARQNELNL